MHIKGMGFANPFLISHGAQEHSNHADFPYRFCRIPRHLLDRSDAAGVFRRKPRPEISRFRGRAGAGAGASRHHPEGGCRRNRAPLQRRRDRHGQAQGTDREDRLSSAAGRATARRAVPRRPWGMVPLGRDHAGHHRHGDGDADPRSADDHRGRYRQHRERACGIGTQIPRYADGGTQQSATGRADHLWLQDGDAARSVRTAQRAPEGIARARAGRRIRRRRRHAVLARRPGARNPGRTDEGIKPRPAGDRLAHGARHALPRSVVSSASSPAPAARSRSTSS